MSFQMNGQSKSSSSCNTKNYDPYMLGGSYGVGVSSSSSGMNNNRCPRVTVRDCMSWPESMGNATNLGGGNNYQGGNWYGAGLSTSQSQGQYQGQYQNQYGQPKAFVSLPGQGQGESSQGVSIPCQIAPLGTNPASLIQPMEPLTYRVASSSFGAANGQGPMTVTLNPQDLYRPRQ